MRLNKYLAASGVASRRKADLLVLEGRILLNGKPITTPGIQVDPRQDEIVVDGKPIAGPEKLDYLIVHKPPEVITTARDPQGRPKVLDLLPPGMARLFPVGRLDSDTEGLLLLTNDGKLAFRLTHPKYGVQKTYRVTLNRPIDEDSLDAVRRGVELADGRTSPAQVTLLSPRERHRLEMTIHEGRNRQVRRVFQSVGFDVVKLKRIRFGSLELGSLARGEWRRLKPAEVLELKNLVRGTHE